MIIPSFAHGHGHGHGHDHHHHETTPPLASKSVEASGAGGCCMADTVDEIKKKEDDLVGEFLKLKCCKTYANFWVKNTPHLEKFNF